MKARFVRPETAKLDLSDGDWVLVKRRLNTGEARRVFTGMVQTFEAGSKATLDPAQVGMTKVLEYLLDWSLRDADGQVVSIREQSREAVRAVLESLDLDTYHEISTAIDAHEAREDAAREQEKNGQDGASGSSPISSSVAG